VDNDTLMEASLSLFRESFSLVFLFVSRRFLVVSVLRCIFHHGCSFAVDFRGISALSIIKHDPRRGHLTEAPTGMWMKPPLGASSGDLDSQLNVLNMYHSLPKVADKKDPNRRAALSAPYAHENISLIS
jgi:hypothetical protein